MMRQIAIVSLICLLSLTAAQAQRVDYVDQVQKLVDEAQRHVSEGKQYSAQGKKSEAQLSFARALKPLRDVLRRDPRNVDALVLSALVYYFLKQPDNTIALLKRHAGRNEVRIHHQLAIAYYFKKQYQQAVPLLIKVVKANDPQKYYDTYILLGSYYYRQGQFETSRPYLETYVKIKPDDHAARGVLGNIYLKQKQYKKALEQFKRIIRKTKGLRPYLRLQVSALVNAGNIYYLQEKYRDAIAIFLKTLAVLEKRKIQIPFRVHFNLAMSYYQAKEWQRAATHFEKFNAMKDNVFIAYHYLGNCHFQLKRYAAAKATYLRVVKLKPNHAESYARLGSLSEALNQPNDALNFYRKANTLKPTDGGIVFRMARILGVQARYDEALPLVRRAIELTPHDATHHAYLAWCLFQKSDFENARKSYEKALSIKANLPNARTGLIVSLNQIALAKIAKNQLKDAEVELRQVLKLNGEDTTALTNLGVLLYHRRRYADALTYLEKAYSKDKSDHGLLIAYTQTLIALKRFARANDVLRTEQNVTTQRDAYYHLLGIASAMLKRHDQAVTYLQRARQLSRNNPKVLTNLAIALLNRGVAALKGGNLRSSSTDFQAALQLNAQLRKPERGLLNFAMAYTLVQTNRDYNRALKLFTAAKTLLGRGALAKEFKTDIQIYLAYCYYKLKRANQLIAIIKDHPAGRQKDSMVQRMLTFTYSKLAFNAFTRGNSSLAEGYLQHGLALHKADKVMQHNQAVLKYIKGEKEDAANTFRRLGSSITEAVLNYGYYLDDQRRDKRSAYRQYKQYVGLGGNHAATARKLMRIKERIFGFR